VPEPDVDGLDVSDELDELPDAGVAVGDAAGSADDPPSLFDVSAGVGSFGFEVELAPGRLSVL
jgi:hypothetical protein